MDTEVSTPVAEPKENSPSTDKQGTSFADLTIAVEPGDDADHAQAYEVQSAAGAATLAYEKLAEFQAARREARQQRFHGVLVTGARGIIVSALMSVIGFVLMALYRTVAGICVLGLGMFIGVLSFLVWSTCPVNELDIDKLAANRPRAATAFMVFCVVFHTASAVTFPPHMHVLAAACPAAYLVGQCMDEKRRPRLTTCFGLVFPVWAAGAAARDLYNPDRNGDSAAARLATQVGAVIYGLEAVASLTWMGWQRRLHYLTMGRRGTGPTLAMYQAIDFFMGGVGSANLLRGVLLCVLVSDPPASRTSIMYALGFAFTFLLPLAGLMVGRDTIYNLVAHRFEANTSRQMQDGAFLAELLDTATVTVGQVWSIHRDLDAPPSSLQAKQPPPDALHPEWMVGYVVEVRKTGFSVELADPEEHSRHHHHQHHHHRHNFRPSLPAPHLPHPHLPHAHRPSTPTHHPHRLSRGNHTLFSNHSMTSRLFS